MRTATAVASAAAMTAVTVANHNKEEEEEVGEKEENFYSYVNLVHNQSFFVPYAETPPRPI
jgi:hypothetical protein